MVDRRDRGNWKRYATPNKTVPFGWLSKARQTKKVNGVKTPFLAGLVM
jgi:hypothetical protein